MFYKFNSMVGRITPATQAEAYSPQGLSSLAREPSTFVFDTKKTTAAKEPAVSVRTVATSAVKAKAAAASGAESLGVIPSNAGYQKIMNMQNLFLKDDGKLVWQKLGGKDRATYLTTVALCVVGSGFLLHQLYKMSFPKKN